MCPMQKIGILTEKEPKIYFSGLEQKPDFYGIGRKKTDFSVLFARFKKSVFCRKKNRKFSLQPRTENLVLLWKTFSNGLVRKTNFSSLGWKTYLYPA